MSKIIVSAAIRGAHKVVKNAAQKLDDAIAKYGPQQEIGYPDTAYFLPIIYSLMGMPVKNLKDAKEVMDRCLEMLPPIPAEKHHLPYLGPGLDAGLATLFAEEIYEAIRILEQPDFYVYGEDIIDKAAEYLGRPGQRHHPA